MVTKLLKGGLLGGLVMFMWLGISWALLPFHMAQFRPIEMGHPVAAMLEHSDFESGIYMYPAMPETGATEEVKQALHEKASSGPTITFMSYQAGGFNPTDPTPYIAGLVSCMLSAGFACMVLLMAAPARLTYRQRVGVAVLFGLAVGFAGHVVNGAFFMFPLAHTVLEVVDQLMGWTLAGLVIAWAVKPPSAQTVDEAGI